jgi:hypothetical protein
MPEDARLRTKVYLDEWLDNRNLTQDNEVYYDGTSGTADSGTTTTTVDSERTEADHYWNDYFIKFGSGPNAGYERAITHFDAATDTITHVAFPNVVANTDTYVISKTSTQVSFIIAYADPDYPLIRVFIDKAVDLVFCVGDPESEAILDSDHYPIGYKESVPITVWCIDKTSITGTKLRWKAEAELRRICEIYPLGGSIRSLERIRDNDKNLGSTILYSREFIMKYERDTT